MVRVNQVDTSLINSEEVGRSQNTDIGNRRFGRCNSGAVTVYGHVAHDVDISDSLAEVVNSGFSRVSHQFH